MPTISKTTTKVPIKTTQPPTKSRHSQSGPGIYIPHWRHKNPKNAFDSFVNSYHSIKSTIQLVSKHCPGADPLFDDILNCGRRNTIYLPKANMILVLGKIVVKLQIVERPMGHCGLKYSKMYGRGTISCLQNYHTIKTSISGKKDRVMHSGMVVYTLDGKKYLIHKGKNLEGRQSASKTVIQVAKEAMFKKGYTKVGRSFKPKTIRNVRDFYKESGSGYDFVTDNCHDGTLRMYDLARKG